MRTFDTLDRATTPDGRSLTLHHRDGDFYIYLDGEELMSTRATGSEEMLAELGCRELAAADRPRVLIGGLGLGYTLRAALDLLPARAQVTVAEILPAVVDWNRSLLSSVHQQSLVDARVEIRTGDVWALLDGNGSFDAILLDVDNGPSAWCLESNDRLYSRPGLQQIHRSLASGGVLAIWSAYADDTFVKRLKKSGFSVQVERARARGRKGARHTIFLARKRS